MPDETDTAEMPAPEDPVLIEVRKLSRMVSSNANASLAAHEEHRRAIREMREDFDDLRGKVERGTASRPPLTAEVREASKRASTANIEVAAVEGRTLAAVAAIESKMVALEQKTDEQTAMLLKIRDAVTSITSNPLAKRVAKGVALLFLGWLATKGLHL